MKKTFQLHSEGKHPDRVLDAVKHEIRKYIKRERRRSLPEGVDFLDFDCKFGTAVETAQVAHPAELMALIEGAAKAGCTQFYLELLAKPGYRKVKPIEAASVTAQGAETITTGGG
ncbi:MAG: DUF6172 family protein [Burkholderiales bacterium]